MCLCVCVCVYEIFVGHFNVKGSKVNGFSLPNRGNLWLFLLLVAAVSRNYYGENNVFRENLLIQTYRYTSPLKLR